MFQLSYHPEVIHDIARLGTKERQRIQLAVETKLTVRPVEFGKPLQYSLSGLRVLRVGDYRVVFMIRAQEVLIVLIAHRSVVYTRMKQRV